MMKLCHIKSREVIQNRPQRSGFLGILFESFPKIKHYSKRFDECPSVHQKFTNPYK